MIGDPPLLLTTEDHSCPVCGITLLASDFETSGEDYYCPYCGTDQKPSNLPLTPTGRPAQVRDVHEGGTVAASGNGSRGHD